MNAQPPDGAGQPIRRRIQTHSPLLRIRFLASSCPELVDRYYADANQRGMFVRSPAVDHLKAGMRLRFRFTSRQGYTLISGSGVVEQVHTGESCKESGVTVAFTDVGPEGRLLHREMLTRQKSPPKTQLPTSPLTADTGASCRRRGSGGTLHVKHPIAPKRSQGSANSCRETKGRKRSLPPRTEVPTELRRPFSDQPHALLPGPRRPVTAHSPGTASTTSTKPARQQPSKTAVETGVQRPGNALDTDTRASSKLSTVPKLAIGGAQENGAGFPATGEFATFGAAATFAVIHDTADLGAMRRPYSPRT